ncbi:MAG: CsgG/HfaB family protein [Acidobacteriota bacterium]
MDPNKGIGVMLLKAVNLVVLLCLFSNVLMADVRVEKVPVICPDLTPDERPTVAVMDFKVKVDVTGDVGGGMASMLSNALLNSGCFNVVERARLDDVMNEQAFGMSGAVTEGSAADVGRILGARYHVMGEITEFSETEAAISNAARRIGRMLGRRAGRGDNTATTVGLRRAHIGFIIRIVDTSSGLALASQSFEKKRNSVGFASASRGLESLTSSGEISKAMADAVEEAIISSVEYLAPYRTQMTDAIPSAQRAHAESSNQLPQVCELLQTSPRPPRILVLIPEEHLLGHFGSYGDQRAFKFDEYEGDRNAQPSSGMDLDAMQESVQRAIRPPDPAGETEIVKRFIQRGFTLIDQKQTESLQEEQRLRAVADNPSSAAAFGRQLSADIVITGEAFSEFSKQINGMFSCRSRVEAKAIEVATGRIIATDGLHASAVDVSEVTAGKTALREAGGKVADYFYTEICSDKQLTLADEAGALLAENGEASEGRATELVVNQIDFVGGSRLQKILNSMEMVSEVQKISFRDGVVRFQVWHSGSVDELAEALLSQSKTFPLKVVGL